MAEIHIEKKKSIWPWIIAALVALLAIWALTQLMNRDNAEATAVEPVGTAAVEAPAVTAPTEPVDAMNTGANTTADAAGALAALPVATILAGPAGYVGQEISGTARVTDVPTDRGFWIEQNGQRMFAVIAEGENMEKAVNINAGQEIQLNGAAVHDANSMAQLGGTLDEQAKQLVSGQQAFLVVEPGDVTVVSR